MKTEIAQISKYPSRTETVALAESLGPVAGINRTLLEDVTVFRASESVPRVPVLYEPCLVFVVQGTKRGFVGEQSFVYNARTVLIMSAPIPFESITEAQNGKPLLAVYIRLHREIVTELMANLQQKPFLRKPSPRAFESIELEHNLADALLRLLRSLGSPDDTHILGKQLIREITYRIMTGRKGDGLRAMVDFGGHFSQLCHALQKIHNDYDQPLEVADLARSCGMSPSVFHLHFKRVTSISPVQYIKAIRLHNARALMLRSNMPAGAAATQVGYKSPSQFGREFKRFFGSSPIVEIEKITAGNDPCSLAKRP